MAPRKPAKKKPAARKTAASAKHRKQGLKVGQRDSQGVKVRSKAWVRKKKDSGKKGKARAKAYKTRTKNTTKQSMYLYDREERKYVKVSSSGIALAERRGGVGLAREGNRYQRVSERTYNAGSTASKSGHRTGTGAYSTAHHIPRKKVIKKRNATQKKKGNLGGRWAGKSYSSRSDTKAAKEKAAYQAKKDRAKSRGGGRR